MQAGLPIASRPIASPASAALTAAPAPAAPKSIPEAARQFEALLMAQLLKEARGDQGGWLGTGEDDSGGALAGELAEEYLAQAMAQRGGLGLATQIAASLSPASLPSQTPAMRAVRGLDR